MSSSASADSRQLGSRIASVLETAAFVLLAGLVAGAPLLHGAMDADTLFTLRVTGLVTLTAVLLAAVVRGSMRLPHPRLLIPLAAHLALVCVSVYRSPYTFGSLQSALDTVVVASGLLVAVSLLDSRWRRKAILGAFLLGASLLAAYGIFQAMGSDLVAPTYKGRVPGLYDNPNHFAGMLDLAAPLSLGLALFSRGLRAKLLFLGLSVLFYANLGLTYSYGGWLAAGTATILLVLVWGVRGVVRNRSLVPLGIGVILIGLALPTAVLLVNNSPRLDGDTLERVGSVLDLESMSSFTSRRAIQRAGITMALEHRWIGVGPGNYSDAIIRYRPEQVTTSADAFLHRTLQHAMSDYLNVATETGLPSLVAFVVFWLMVLTTVPRRLSPGIRYGGVAALGAILLHGLVDGNLTYVSGNAFLAFTLAGVLHSVGPAPGDHSAEGAEAHL